MAIDPEAATGNRSPITQTEDNYDDMKKQVTLTNKVAYFFYNVLNLWPTKDRMDNRQLRKCFDVLETVIDPYMEQRKPLCFFNPNSGQEEIFKGKEKEMKELNDITHKYEFDRELFVYAKNILDQSIATVTKTQSGDILGLKGRNEVTNMDDLFIAFEDAKEIGDKK